jgi:molecular chaperone DnaK
MANQNRTIGRFHLDGIPPAPRGIPQIEVTFDIDANGILNVSAKDKATGKEQKIRIEASSGLTDEEIRKMKEEAEKNADSDKKAKEEIDALNAADALIFSTEKQLKEYGDKIPADKKAPIESTLEKLKDAHKSRDFASIEKYTTELTSVWTAASEDMYKATQGAPEGPTDAANEAPQKDITDVDFEDVHEEK